MQVLVGVACWYFAGTTLVLLWYGTTKVQPLNVVLVAIYQQSCCD
jgi:hypothetical protein